MKGDRQMKHKVRITMTAEYWIDTEKDLHLYNNQAMTAQEMFDIDVANFEVDPELILDLGVPINIKGELL